MVQQSPSTSSVSRIVTVQLLILPFIVPAGRFPDVCVVGQADATTDVHGTKFLGTLCVRGVGNQLPN